MRTGCSELLFKLLVYLSPHELLPLGTASRVLYFFTYIDDFGAADVVPAQETGGGREHLAARITF